MNSFFGYSVVEKLKLICFDYEQEIVSENKKINKDVEINEYKNKINDVKNDKIKKSLMKFAKVFKEK